jgi:hypothetical protein
MTDEWDAAAHTHLQSMIRELVSAADACTIECSAEAGSEQRGTVLCKYMHARPIHWLLGRTPISIVSVYFMNNICVCKKWKPYFVCVPAKK